MRRSLRAVSAPDGASPLELSADALGTEGRKIRIMKLERDPFQIRRLRHDRLKQRPNRLGAGPGVGIGVHTGELASSSDMHLDDRIQIELAQKTGSVEAMIARIGVEIVQIKKQCAAAIADKGVEELRLSHVLVAKAQIGDRIFDQEWRGNAWAERLDSRCHTFEHIEIER